MMGESSSGMKKFLPSAEKFTWLMPVAIPAPTSAPVSPWVVEMGKPSNVARITVAPAPNATARRKAGCVVNASGTSPLPENFLSSD